MPHITVEATPRLATAIDFRSLFLAIHRRLDEEGYASQADFKSRVLVAEHHLSGEDTNEEFIVARLVTTHPRPEATRRAMTRIVQEMLAEAISAEQPDYPWQCCALNDAFALDDYFKTLSPRQRAVT